MKCVVSVLGKDRSGIVAEVATALAACGANIDDISQTILDDIFSMTMLTTLNPEVADFNTVQEKLEAVGESLGVQIIVQREDVHMVKRHRQRHAQPEDALGDLNRLGAPRRFGPRVGDPIPRLIAAPVHHATRSSGDSDMMPSLPSRASARWAAYIGRSRRI